MRFPYQVVLTTPGGENHVIAYRSTASKAEAQANEIRDSLGKGRTAAGFVVSVERR